MNTRSFLCTLLALISLAFLNGCIQPPPGSESEVWRRPPRYGAGGTANRNRPPGNEGDRSSRSSRYGYSGSEEAPPSDTPGETNTSRDRDRESGVASSGDNADDKPAVEKPVKDKKKSGPPAVSEMPFAKGVPGKPLLVTVPGHGNLGEISIEQYDASNQPTGKPLPPGTPVEIPDPGNPGNRIYFKVP